MRRTARSTSRFAARARGPRVSGRAISPKAISASMPAIGRSRAANPGRSRLSAGSSDLCDSSKKLPERQLRAVLPALQLLLVFLLAAACLYAANPEKEVEALVASAASDLSAGNIRSFLEAFDKSMPGYEKLSTAVQGLYSQANLSCSIE